MSFGSFSNDINVKSIQDAIRSAVGTTAVQLDTSKLDAREGVTIWSNKDIYVGVSSSVTSSDKYIFKVFANQLVNFRAESSVDIYAISDTASAGPDDVLLGQYK